MIDKGGLSERDICTKFTRSALCRAGWYEMLEIREEAMFAKDRIFVRGKLAPREKVKRTYSIVYFKPNIPIAVIESKDNYHVVSNSMQQAIDYTETQHVPFAFSSPEWERDCRPRPANRR